MKWLREKLYNLALDILLRDLDIKDVADFKEEDKQRFWAELWTRKIFVYQMKAIVHNDVQRNLYVYDVHRQAFIRGELFRTLKILNLAKRAYQKQVKKEGKEKNAEGTREKT